MAIPLIPIISGLTSLAPTIAKWIGGDKAEEAAQNVADIARQVTGQNDAEKAVQQIQGDPQAQLEFLKMLEQNKAKLDEIYLGDRQNARDMYGKHNQQADKIADRVTKFNGFYVGVLILINCLVVYFLKEDAALVAVASNLIGMAMKSLLDQIQSVISFYFGSSLGSKNKVSK